MPHDDQTQTVFVLGREKTGTSSIVSMLNAHKSVFVLFEVDFRRRSDHARNKNLLSTLPGSGSLFSDDDSDLSTPYIEFARLVEAEKGIRFQWVGTKLPGLQRDLLPLMGDLPVITTVRDVVTWSAKNKVILNLYPTADHDIVPAVTEYVRYFIELFSLQNRIIIRLEDMVTDPQACIDKVSTYLGLEEEREQFENWWAKHSYAPGDPKLMINWYNHHKSAFTPPATFDTKAKVSGHPFWQAILPVFNRYYEAAGKPSSPRIDTDTMEQDLAVLDEIQANFSVPLKHAFRKLWTRTIAGYNKNEDGTFNILVDESQGSRKL